MLLSGKHCPNSADEVVVVASATVVLVVELPSPQPCRMNAGSVKDAKFQGLMASTFHGGNVSRRTLPPKSTSRLARFFLKWLFLLDVSDKMHIFFQQKWIDYPGLKEFKCQKAFFFGKVDGAVAAIWVLVCLCPTKRFNQGQHMFMFCNQTIPPSWHKFQAQNTFGRTCVLKNIGSLTFAFSANAGQAGV